MITTTLHDDRTRTVSYYGRLLGHYGPGRLLGHYGPVRYKRTHARAWRCVTVLGALGYARNEADARRWLMEMVP